MGAEEAFRRALAGDEGAVIRIAIGGQQVGRIGVGAGDHQRRHAEHVGRRRAATSFWIASCVGTSTCRPYGRISSPPPAGLQSFGGAGGDHRFHQLEGVQHAAEAGFRIGDDRQEIIGVAFAARLIWLAHWI